jgi:hypothetical protein
MSQNLDRTPRRIVTLAGLVALLVFIFFAVIGAGILYSVRPQCYHAYLPHATAPVNFCPGRIAPRR